MKTIHSLSASLMLAAAPVLAQNEYVWTSVSNVTGKVAAAWSDNENFDVRVSIRSLGTWSEYEIIPSSEGTFPIPINIQMDSLGNIILVWGDSYNGIIMSSIKPVLGSWTSATAISSLSEYCSEPTLTLDPAGNATAVWLNYSQGIQTSTLPVGTTTWSAVTTISQ